MHKAITLVLLMLGIAIIPALAVDALGLFVGAAVGFAGNLVLLTITGGVLFYHDGSEKE